KAGLMGLTFVIAVEHMKGNADGKYSITANALAPAGMTRMVGQIPGMEGKPMPPEMNPELNGPIVAFLASDQAGNVNGQIFARRGLRVMLVDRDAAALRTTVDELRAAGANARAVDLDLARDDVADALAAATGGLDIGLLVCNAAIGTVSPFLDMTGSELQAML